MTSPLRSAWASQAPGEHYFWKWGSVCKEQGSLKTSYLNSTVLPRASLILCFQQHLFFSLADSAYMNNGLGMDVWKQALDWLADLWLVTSYPDRCWLCIPGEGHAAGISASQTWIGKTGARWPFSPIPPQPTPQDARPGQKGLQDLKWSPPPY